jgi:hypothetical protein
VGEVTLSFCKVDPTQLDPDIAGLSPLPQTVRVTSKLSYANATVKEGILVKCYEKVPNITDQFLLRTKRKGF